MKPQGYVPPSAPDSAHEMADLNVPLIVRVAIILGVTLVVLVLLVAALFHGFNRAYPHRTSEASPVVTKADLPPVPRLQTDPTGDLQALLAREDVHLEHYAWVDRSQGIAQIPIERAMTLWVKTYSPPPASSGTNATPATTELDMRQSKTPEAPHAP